MGNHNFQRGRFKSKTEALHMRVHVYVCQYCNMQHKGGKPLSCNTCGRGAFFHFDSIMEANRFGVLSMLQNNKHITDLRLQVPFPIYNNGHGILSPQKTGKPLFRYYADFVYQKEGEQVVEDVKGDPIHGQTDVFKLKRKLIEAAYQIEIKIT